MSPKVSVIVPNYNHAPYLRQRLDSIFNQTFQDFEVIILDDCSTDNSKEIIEEYRSKPQVSHIVYNETNSGSPFKQWAKGFELAQGEYIWIAESDDWAELNFLEENVPILAKDKTLSLVFCNSFNEDSSTEIKKQNSFDSSIKLSSKDMLLKYMNKGCAVYNASSVLFKANYANQVNQDYQNFKSSGDYFFWICLIEKGNVYYNYNCLNHYRIHYQNTSIIHQQSGQAFFEDLKIFKYLKSKKYQTFYNIHAVVLANLKEIKTEIKKNPNNQKLFLAKKQWKKEIFSILLSKLIVKSGLLIWKILFRKKL